jgi:ATP-dependent DNA helicase DinG
MTDLAAVFASHGPLARALPAYEPRRPQVRMAEEVRSALDDGRHLLVEAGTGVGKSLAYLVPAVLWAAAGRAGGRRIVVSTYTRALQEQLARKDLPLLERALASLGIEFRHALLMGSENYLCVQRLAQVRQQPELPGGAGSDLGEALAHYAESAVSGLRSEIPFQVPDGVWTAVRRDRDICLGPRGPFWDACLYRRDLVRAREAEIIVVNHALFFLDLALGGRILPPHDAAILDEGHRAEEVAAAQFGTSLGPAAVGRLLADLRPSPGPRRRRRRGAAADGLPAQGQDLAEAAARVGREAEAFFAEARRVAADLLARRGREGREPRADAAFAVRLRPGALPDDRLGAPLRDLAAAIEDEARRATDPVRSQTLAALGMRAADLRERADLFVRQSRDDAVYWVEAAPAARGGATLHAAPVEVAPILRQRLFESGRTVILTSATLTAAGSFAHLRGRLGLTAASEAALGSPYDYTRQALLYLPDRMPDPASEPAAFAAAVAGRCRELIIASDGGVLVLFTSYSLLNQVHATLAADPAMRGRPLFRHAPDGAATSLLEEFRAGRRGVLLGTLTFWQGVDVPGEALRCVVITRLPFEVPDHPVAEARAETIRARGGDPFQEDSLPEAILTFRQGFGRLIRSADDRGVVAVLDPRVLTRGYGAAFLESLPPCRRVSGIDEVAAFFALSQG